MILIWGLPADPPIGAVAEALERRHAPFLLLNQQLALETSIELHVGDRVCGEISIGGQKHAVEDIKAAYLRPHDSRRLPNVAAQGEGSPNWQHAVGLEDSLLMWSEITSALVVSRPRAMATNGSKPYQSAYARARGFMTPETLITSDRDAALAFWEHHKDVIYKSTSGIRSIVARLTASHRLRFEHLECCPTQFQQYVPGDDYRVHVVDGDCFASKILSDADDYRYAQRQGGSDIDVRSHELDDETTDRCRLLASDLNLPVAGIDLRQTPDGTWYCFEVNPSPGFTFYENWTGQPIADAVARLLETGAVRAAPVS